jgi:hypothetical protein
MSVLTITPQLRTTNLDRSIRFYTTWVSTMLTPSVSDFAPRA